MFLVLLPSCLTVSRLLVLLTFYSLVVVLTPLYRPGFHLKVYNGFIKVGVWNLFSYLNLFVLFLPCSVSCFFLLWTNSSVLRLRERNTSSDEMLIRVRTFNRCRNPSWLVLQRSTGRSADICSVNDHRPTALWRRFSPLVGRRECSRYVVMLPFRCFVALHYIFLFCGIFLMLKALFKPRAMALNVNIYSQTVVLVMSSFTQDGNIMQRKSSVFHQI